MKYTDRSVDVYQEKDNLIELGEVQEKYSRLMEKITQANNTNEKTGSEDFIRKYFFNVSKNDKKITFLYSDSIIVKMGGNTLDFAEKIAGKTKRFPEDAKFKAVLTVLRRWNSFTPALASSVNPSKGGGYFLYCQFKNDSYGIAIDPGYDFLDNFFSQGFRIGDIDAVMVSHAHPDHTDNLPSILSLYHELNGRLGEYYHDNRLKKRQFDKKHLKLIISQGVFDQYYKLIKPSEESLKDIFVIQTDNNIHKNNNYWFEHEFDIDHNIQIKAVTTSHKDLGRWESLGFIIKIKNNRLTRLIGYTSDAHWKLDFAQKFKGCHIIYAHLGSIVDILKKKEFCSLCGGYEENGDGKCKECEKCEKKRFRAGKPRTDKLIKQAQEQNHLYLSGLTMFFDDLLQNAGGKNHKMELAIISEFGEELKGGIRMDIFHKFDDWFQVRSPKKSRCFPGDIGLEVDIFTGNVYCHCCKRFVDRSEIEPVPYGKEEAICFVCKECQAVLSSYQIDHILKEYCENGRKLESMEPNTIGGLL